ncbi:spore germination protein YaaH [Lachnotalea glycerini]|uniref:Glycosyl hydrolase family 18 n=1 Tax=Lachnotalea glycerini TaxID=1763509 RepID=A0A255I3V8_9FIRM|nr:glycosyl hydrolase family 18 protein [Lachnotalea glycerini]PXV91010.1 spore germination protein YaaH [Lachnotalea glycerini]RDY30109.1 glycosyl hydrolase family 18 [Lachnotalea glycerini]
MRRKTSPEVRKKMISILATIILLVIVIMIYIVGNIIEKYTPTDERAVLAEYFNLSKEDEVALILQNTKVEDKGLIFNDEIYIEYSTVKNNLNSRFYWDPNENILLYTTPTDVISASVGSKDYYIGKAKNTENYVIVKVDGNNAYIALDFVQKYTNIAYEKFSEPNRVHITNEWGDVTYAEVKKDDSVRVKGGIKSPILTDVTKGSKLTVIEQGEVWSKVRSADAYIGYIKNKNLINIVQQTETKSFEEPVYTSISKDYDINLVWHQITEKTANDKLLTLLADTKGVNTISPTWFSLSDNDGNITSLADSTYVQHAHQLGIEVWALIDNFNDNVSTYEVLSYTSKRERLINQIIAAAIEYDLDGINIDFEELKTEEGEHFIEFIRELSIKCRNNGIVLSIDNYVPTEFSALYNRKEQGIVADYVIIMGYDEHYATSEEPGSVSSISFVRSGIENTLLEVPKEKVINAIPFYTRLWIETPKSEEEIAAENENTEYIPYTLSSEVYSMANADKLIAANGISPEWDETTAQYYSKYEIDGVTYEIWFEEETSIEEKMKLIDEFELAGVACWKLGLEKQSIWDTIIKYVN